MNNSKEYLKAVYEKIDGFEHPENRKPEVLNPDSYGTVDSDGYITQINPAEERYLLPDQVDEINDKLPRINPDKIDGVLDLYRELNRTYGLKFDADGVTSISDTFKSIIDPTKKEIFEIYLREYIDRLRLASINQLGNTVYSLITRLTSKETIQSLTISEQVALLDRLFEYMDKVNNMVQYIPKGDTNTELRELAERQLEEDGGSTKLDEEGRANKRELVNLTLKLINKKLSENDSKNS